MFSSIGVVPISLALAGALIAWNLTTVFITAGLIVTLITLLSALNPAVRAMHTAQSLELKPIEA